MTATVFDTDGPIVEIIGKTIVKISDTTPGQNEIIFTMSDGTKYRMYHSQD